MIMREEQAVNYICGEWVEEGQHGWGRGPGLHIEDGDPEVHPGHAEGEGGGPLRSHGDISYAEVCGAVHDLTQHPVPVSRRDFRLGAIVPIVHKLDCVVKPEEVGQVVRKVDREALKPRISLELLLRLDKHHKRIILKPNEVSTCPQQIK